MERGRGRRGRDLGDLILYNYVMQLLGSDQNQPNILTNKNTKQPPPIYPQKMQQEQTYFGQQLDQIHQTYIKTSYGNIFAHVVGKHGQPLIIIVHGSGPRNSADQYLYFLHQYLVRVSYVEKFFIVAIDCPGYGRSKGSKEAVKTFPLQMFKEILKDLGYTNYFAMLGHSQGGAAIFNAVYEDPKLTEFLLMDRPVCGNIKRFNKFPIPTLLLYDIEDDGHPIWQGKLLFKQLLSSEFYTYRNSQNTFYVPDNIWNLALNLFRKYSTERKTLMSSNFSRGLLVHRSLSIKQKNKAKSQSKQKKHEKKTVSTSKYDQIKKERKRSEESLVQIVQIDKSEIYSRVADLEEMEELPTWLNQPKVEQTEEDVKKEEEQRKKQQQKLKKKIKIEEIQPEPIKRQKKQKKQEKEEKEQKKSKQSPKIEKKKQKRQSPMKKQEQKKEVESQAEDKCSICHENYYYPIQTNCKHLFCKKCLGQSLLVDQRCPLCRTKVTKKSQRLQLHNKIKESMSDKEKQRRQRDLNQFQLMLKSIVYIEIGNNSRQLATKQSPFTKTKKKYVWQIYAKEPKNFKFQQVSFNINMGNRDSVPVRVTHAPFVFESRGTFSFSCEIIIKPKNRDYAPITSIYRIDVQPGNHSKIIAVRKKKI